LGKRGGGGGGEKKTSCWGDGYFISMQVSVPGPRDNDRGNYRTGGIGEHKPLMPGQVGGFLFQPVTVAARKAGGSGNTEAEEGKSQDVKGCSN